MNFETQILFFFSALGAFNGFLLSAYFAFFIKHKSKATYFLSALIFVVSVRVAKSVFLIYDPSISSLFIQIGLSACALIGPFLYLYVKAASSAKKSPKWSWLLHILPVILIMIISGYLYPYKEHRLIWHRSGYGLISYIYFQWFVYVVLSGVQIRSSVQRVFSKTEKPTDVDIWLINIVTGVGLIWLAYYTVGYTSYIVGALSFSFVFYLMLLLWIFKRRNSPAFFEKHLKYVDKKIPTEATVSMAENLEELFSAKELYKNPELKLSELAEELEVAPNYLSQYLNDHLGKSFTTLINEHRVDAAEKMLRANDLLTVEAIGNECGFKSNSAFYTAFKKYKGITPGKFKKSIE